HRAVGVDPQLGRVAFCATLKATRFDVRFSLAVLHRQCHLHEPLYGFVYGVRVPREDPQVVGPCDTPRVHHACRLAGLVETPVSFGVAAVLFQLPVSERDQLFVWECLQFYAHCRLLAVAVIAGALTVIPMFVLLCIAVLVSGVLIAVLIFNLSVTLRVARDADQIAHFSEMRSGLSSSPTP